MKLRNLRHKVFFILLLIPLISSSQTNIDSLKNLLKKSSDIDRINILIDLSKAYKRISPEKTIEYALEAYRLAKIQDNELLIASSLGNAGDGEILLGHLDTAKSYYIKSYNLYNKLNNLEGLSEAYLDLGNIYFFNSQYDSAAIYYEKSIGFTCGLFL